MLLVNEATIGCGQLYRSRSKIFPTCIGYTKCVEILNSFFLQEIFSSSYFFSPTVLALNDNAVCDTKNTRHEDVCKLARKSKLDYKGTCQVRSLFRYLN